MSEPITIAAILSTAAVIIAIVRSIQGNNKEQRTEGKTEAQQLAALQLAQVQAAAQAQQAIAQATSQWQLSLFQSEAKLAKQMDQIANEVGQIANEVGQIAKSVASFTKETEERFRSDDRDFNRVIEKLAKHGAQLDSLLVQETHNTGSHHAIQAPRPSHGGSGESNPHLPAMRPIPDAASLRP